MKSIYSELYGVSDNIVLNMAGLLEGEENYRLEITIGDDSIRRFHYLTYLI